jgi:hypothetical protein
MFLYIKNKKKPSLPPHLPLRIFQKAHSYKKKNKKEH